ncbi:hypothetical protein PR003_g30528 [Phytophthora rubi]|uniref:DDE Tnp4 domain-containing protein n=3 Tax=Phytophthora rubi TaxID=129364 RepID=A0A6A3GZR7_9STRA|nr:hypothetical protein PR001_g29785 [Phytophthora rubi]KAE9271367.1 hypothetical protein PR003_g30528 [Phytophthora rubi]
MTRSERAIALEWLEAAMVVNEVAGGAEGDEEAMLHKAISNNRYLTRGSVEKTGKWDKRRVERADSLRAKRDLRMHQETFVILLGRLRDHPVFHRTPGKQEQAPAQLQLEVFLYSLQPLTIHQVAQHFGIAEGSVCKYSSRAIEAILSLEDDFLSWPSASRKTNVQKYFEGMSGFPSCLGCVDGTTFKLLYAPSTNPECYFSRKSDYCIGAQIFCDHRRRITFYQVGVPGSLHDTRSMSLTRVATEPTAFFKPGEYVLGDSAYGCKFPFIVTPYKMPSSSIPRNRTFNWLLAKQRIIVEHTIGMIKARFPVLSCLRDKIKDDDDLQFVCKKIVCCFILHNLCIALSDDSFAIDKPAVIAEEEDDDHECSEDSSEDLRVCVQELVLQRNGFA